MLSSSSDSIGTVMKPIYDAEIEEKGYYEWKVRVARKPVVGRIFPGDVENFASWDTSFMWDFPSNVEVLSIHGINDTTVPV